MEEIAYRHRVGARGPHAPRCEPSSTVRRDRRGHSARRSAVWNSTPTTDSRHSRRRQAGGARAGRLAQGARSGGISLMAARILDGTADRESDPGGAAARRRSLHIAGGPAARPRHRAGRRRSGLARVRQQQAEVAPERPAFAPTCSGCPRSASLADVLDAVDRLNQQRGARRHPRAVAAAGRDGRRRGAARVRCRPRRQGRRRISSPQRRSARAESGRARRLHAVWRHRAARAVVDCHRRRARRRHRPERYRRETDGAAAAAPARHGDDLSFADRRPRRAWLRRPTFWLRRSAVPAS